MEYLKIENNGELDVRLISLMGGSTKQGQSTKIGKFGTGLKYSLAWLVRNNIDFKIFIGENEVKITKVREHIQSTDFDIIYIDGQRSSITSTMGVDWNGWMICRELWCNALDEGGNKKEITNEIKGVQGKTTFFVQAVGEIKETIDKWSEYFIEKEPIYSTKNFAIYSANENFCVYKNGVLIYKDEEMKSVFSYDIKLASINELREYKGMLSLDIFNIIAKMDSKCIEIFLSTINDKCYEWDMDYEWSCDFGAQWKTTIGDGKIISKEDFEFMEKKGIDIDKAGLIVTSPALYKKLAGEIRGISAVRRADKVSSFFETVDTVLEQQIKEAVTILESCGYFIDAELKFINGVFGDPSKFAQINIDEKVVMFSQELKNKSLFQMVAVIIEENEHYKTGFSDCSRSFQQHFIDLFTKTLLTTKQIKL